MPVADKNMVTIYDMKQKLIAYSSPLPGVREVLYERGSFYVLTAGNKLVMLQEIDIHQKLEMLFKKNLYSMAVSIAKSQDLGESGLMEIFRQYADHLYSKSDFDGAIQQYIKTIGHLEPSYVIRKFLDAQQIRNLTSYLQAMHEKGLANEDHTTLLLNCFTKLKDVQHLNKFIMTPETALHFDVETAIRVCRQAGYHQHALQLAEKHNKHKWYLKIQLEDTQEYQKALAYIKKLPFHEVETTLKQYGKVLVHNAPVATTELLKSLCTGTQPSENGSNPFDEEASSSKTPNGEEFIHIFVNSPDMLVEFLQHIIKVQSKTSVTVYNTLLELYLRKLKTITDPLELEKLELRTMDLLLSFSQNKFETDQAAILCQVHDFRAGILYLYESAGLYQQILRYHMDHGSFDHVLATCRRYGEKDSVLWQQALTYFVNQPSTTEEGGSLDCKQYIQQVVQHIDKNDILPPLLVIQLLSRNPSAQLGLVKDYILRRISQGSEDIRKYQESITELREETENMEKKIDEMKTSAMIFKETKCSLCNHELELPAVHFLCGHAYHQHCFESYADNENECPICAGKNRKLIEDLRHQEQLMSNSHHFHEQFTTQLRKKATNGGGEGFSVIADYFSKGVFNKVTLLDDTSDAGGNNPFVTSSSRSSSNSGSHRIDPTLQKELLMTKN